MKQETAIRLLTLYSGVLTAAVAVLFTTAAVSPGRHASYEQIDVQRINLREPDGTLRMVISNQKQFPGYIFKGHEYAHDRRSAGMIFYNEEGTENGGLTFAGSRDKDGKIASYGHLSFDPYENDQVVSLDQREFDGARFAGLTINDRPTKSIEPFVAHLDEMKALSGAEFRNRSEELGALPAPTRLFLGKSDQSRESAVLLADAAGRPRLKMRVGDDGRAAIEFLDEDGKVARTLTADAQAR